MPFHHLAFCLLRRTHRIACRLPSKSSRGPPSYPWTYCSWLRAAQRSGVDFESLQVALRWLHITEVAPVPPRIEHQWGSRPQGVFISCLPESESAVTIRLQWHSFKVRFLSSRVKESPTCISYSFSSDYLVWRFSLISSMATAVTHFKLYTRYDDGTMVCPFLLSWIDVHSQLESPRSTHKKSHVRINWW